MATLVFKEKVRSVLKEIKSFVGNQRCLRIPRSALVLCNLIWLILKLWCCFAFSVCFFCIVFYVLLKLSILGVCQVNE